MKTISRQFIGPIGMTLTCTDKYEWVYVGYRITRVKTYEHHFARSDFICELGPWIYHAVNDETLKNKFPKLEFPK